MEIDYNNADNSLKEKAIKNENMTQEMNKIQGKYIELNLKYQKLKDENNNLLKIIEKNEIETQRNLEKHNSLLLEAQKVFNRNIIQSFESKLGLIENAFKDKATLLKNKIIEQKTNKINLEKYIENEKNNLVNIKNNNAIKEIQMTEEMILIKNEWEKKYEEQVKSR